MPPVRNLVAAARLVMPFEIRVETAMLPPFESSTLDLGAAARDGKLSTTQRGHCVSRAFAL